MSATTPRRVGPSPMHRFNAVHFIGIGGAGMSGIAEVMINLGFQVSGSDRSESNTTRRLKKLGARIYQGHRGDYAQGADVVVISSAIPDDNPELAYAREERIPVVPRAEMLGELMRFRRGVAVAGTHGKTTTTSLTATVLAEAGLDPTFVIGGLLNATGSNARLGEGEVLVAEADESDGSFLYLQPVVAVVTNVDRDHLSHYENDFSRLRSAFLEFLHHLPFYGVAILCLDDEHVAGLIPDLSRATLTYGQHADADVRAGTVEQNGLVSSFDLHLPDGSSRRATLNHPGQHNVLNALAACAVAWELGVPGDDIVRGLARFDGIGRRFSVTDNVRVPGGRVTLVDDYGHHPSELNATLATARKVWPTRRLFVLFQPHRYTRTRDLFEDFATALSDVDALILADVYAAGEDPIPEADGRALCRAVRTRGQVDPVFVEHPADALSLLPGLLRDQDVLIVQGAGDVGGVAASIRDLGLLPVREAGQ